MLFANVLFAIMMQFGVNQRSSEEMPILLNVESIKILPRHIPCLEWGSFYGEDLKRIEAILQKQELTNIVSKRLVSMENIHWIYIPPFKETRLAEKEVRKLKQLGIDSFRVQEKGKWNNAISITTFHDENAARQLLEELRSKGIRTAKIGMRELQQTKLIIREPKLSVYEKIKIAADQFGSSTLVTTVCERI